jgi:hypothetical protein
VVDNLHISELNVLVTLATDVILLLIMFFGLLRLGFHDHSTFGLGRLLWKQVGYWCFSLAVVFSAYMVTHIHKGVIWLFVATIAEVVPAVSGLTRVPLLFVYRDTMPQVFLCLNLNSRLLFCPFCQRKSLIGLDWTIGLNILVPFDAVCSYHLLVRIAMY